MRAAAVAIAEFVEKYNLDGINMDIEEFYNTISNIGQKYNELIGYIDEELEKSIPILNYRSLPIRVMRKVHGISREC